MFEGVFDTKALRVVAFVMADPSAVGVDVGSVGVAFPITEIPLRLLLLLLLRGLRRGAMRLLLPRSLLSRGGLLLRLLRAAGWGVTAADAVTTLLLTTLLGLRPLLLVLAVLCGDGNYHRER